MPIPTLKTNTKHNLFKLAINEKNKYIIYKRIKSTYIYIYIYTYTLKKTSLKCNKNIASLK